MKTSDSIRPAAPSAAGITRRNTLKVLKAPAAAPTPQFEARDPITIDTSNMDRDQSEQLQKVLRKTITVKLSEMCAARLQTIAAFLEIVEDNGGYDTPAEEFLADLVDQHHRRAITPSEVAHKLEEFRGAFDGAIATALRITKQYPAQVKCPTAGALAKARKMLLPVSMEGETSA